jgi:hypothetical protein
MINPTNRDSMFLSMNNPTNRDEAVSVNLYDFVTNAGQAGYLPYRLISKFASKSLTKAYLSEISLFFALFGTVDVLNSAYKRKRLDGTTFKYLNLGLVLSTMLYLMKGWRSIYYGGMAMRMGDLIGSVLFITSGVAAASKLFKYGLPSLRRFKWKGEKGSCPLSSFLYLVSTITTFASSARVIFNGMTTVWGTRAGLVTASVSCGLLPIISLVEHQSCLSRKLNSATYQDLNWALLLTSAISILTAPVGSFWSVSDVRSPWIALHLISLISSLSASVLGLQIGYTTGK